MLTSDLKSKIPIDALICNCILFSPEENGDTDDTDVYLPCPETNKRFVPTNLHPVASISIKEHIMWHQSSEALIIHMPHTSMHRETSMSETVMLADILSKEHGFSVTVLSDEVTVTSIKTIIDNILEKEPSRFFIYVVAPVENSNIPYGMVLPDSSVLNFKQLVKDIDYNNGHIVFAVDSGDSFYLLAKKDTVLSHVISIKLTEGLISFRTRPDAGCTMVYLRHW